MAQPGSLENAVVAAALCALRLEQGRVQSAFMQATSSAALFLELGLPVSARYSYALSALSLALAGVAGKAAETLAELDGLGLPTDMVYECGVLEARAWTAAAGGDMGSARQHLEVAVELGVQADDLIGATRALHGLARMGRARQVLDQLGDLAGKVDGEMTAVRLSYAAAAAAKDSAALLDASARFEELGANLFAAEAMGEAAVQLRREGSSRDAAAAQQKAARLLALRRRDDAVRAGDRRPRAADPRRARHGAAGGDGQHGQADCGDDASVGPHRGEPAAPGLPEARAVPPQGAGRGLARPPRRLSRAAGQRIHKAKGPNGPVAA
jgi:hypothetical protein